MQQNRQITHNLVYWLFSYARQYNLLMSLQPVIQDQHQYWKEQVSALALNKDKNAYHALYSHFAPKVISFYKQQGMLENAEELTHEVFIKIWQKAQTYNPSKAQVSTWIFTIVRNTRIDYLRKKKLDLVENEAKQYLDETSNLEKQVASLKTQSQLLATVKLLNDEQRDVIQKVYFEDHSHQAAAEALNMTPGTVKSRVRSALKIMRQQMGGEYL